MNSSLTLITIGDLVADLVVPIERLPIEANQHQFAKTIRIEPGGMGNTLIMAQRLGLHAKAIGSIGGDHFGRIALDMLTQEGVDTSLVVTQPDSTTTTALVIVDKQADHVFVGKFGTADPLAFDPAWAAEIARADALFTNGYSLAGHGSVDHASLVHCLQIAGENGVPICFDLGPAFSAADRAEVKAVLEFTNIFLATDEELCQWIENEDLELAAALLLLRYPIDAAVIKLGADGCRIFTTEEAVSHNGFSVTVRDTAGAGDAFAGGVLYGLTNGLDTLKSAKWGNYFASQVVARFGPRLPESLEAKKAEIIG